MILFAQVFGIFWSKVTSEQKLIYGQHPRNGFYRIEGSNDEPYSDRLIACVRQGRMYKPVQLNDALSSSNAIVVDTNGTAINGYRVCARHEMSLDSTAVNRYATACNALAETLDGIFSSCTALGYTVTRDALRVVDDVQSSTMKLVLKSLPVLIMPFWDNGFIGRYVVPGWDGSACVFRLSGKYEIETSSVAYLRGISRSFRESKTVEWLGRPGGVWRNGWYEDPDGMKWYSDVFSTIGSSEYARQRQFDTIDFREMSCTNALVCEDTPLVQVWGDSLSYSESAEWFHSVVISNGHRFGLFMYEAMHTTAVTSKYSIDILISNLSLALLLFRWFASILAFQNSINSGMLPPATIGIGCVSCSQYFTLLPILLLPRLKTTFAAFFTVGCRFEGEQNALAEAWFVMYPAIGELVLLYFSLLASFARCLRRRMTDNLFGPTLVFFYLMHYLRYNLARSGWFEFDGRISTIVMSADFAKLRLTDFFTSDAALRMNGNIKSLFFLKIAVLALNLVPLFWSKSASRGVQSSAPLEIEKAIAIRAATVGGLGWPSTCKVSRKRTGTRDIPIGTPSVNAAPSRVLPAYELLRIGYIVLGTKHLVSMNDWIWFMAVYPFRLHQPFSNLRVCVYNVTEDATGSCRVDEKPHFSCVSDPAFQSIRCFDISLRSFR